MSSRNKGGARGGKKELSTTIKPPGVFFCFFQPPPPRLPSPSPSSPSPLLPFRRRMKIINLGSLSELYFSLQGESHFLSLSFRFFPSHEKEESYRKREEKGGLRNEKTVEEQVCRWGWGEETPLTLIGAFKLTPQCLWRERERPGREMGQEKKLASLKPALAFYESPRETSFA